MDEMSRTAIGNEPKLDRREAMRALLDGRSDLLLVTGLGSTTWDAAAIGDDARNFYLWGAMGGAAMLGLGLAIARPERRGRGALRAGRERWGVGAPAPPGGGGAAHA